jgi:hypothetical protein
LMLPVVGIHRKNMDKIQCVFTFFIFFLFAQMQFPTREK